jgi:uncharacterized protein YcbK (DUF882 family)
MAQTNAQLEGAALNSQHLQAKALDTQLPSVDNDAVAVDFRTIVCGGVGCTPAANLPILGPGSLQRWVG